jgi:glycine cleavage system regulatory protein
MGSSPKATRRSKNLAKARRPTPGLVAAGQAVEHYEMARYGALAGWVMQLGMKDAAALLNETLQEEMNAEKLLTQIAKSKAHKKLRRWQLSALRLNRQLARLRCELAPSLARAGSTYHASKVRLTFLRNAARCSWVDRSMP